MAKARRQRKPTAAKGERVIELGRITPDGVRYRFEMHLTWERVRPIDRAAQLLRDLYPAKANMPRSLKAATKAVNEECRKVGWQALSPDTIHRAAVRLGYRRKRT